MKKIIIGIISLVLVLSMAACSSVTESADVNAIGKSVVKAAGKLPEMLTVSSDSDDAETLFKSISDMDYSKIDGFYLSYSADGTAYEIAVVEAKDESDIKELEKSLSAHLTSRINLYKAYSPKQTAQAEKAEIVTSGKLCAMIMCEDTASAVKAFKNN